MSGTALAAGVGENDRRLAPCRSRDTIFNRNGGEPKKGKPGAALLIGTAEGRPFRALFSVLVWTQGGAPVGRLPWANLTLPPWGGNPKQRNFKKRKRGTPHTSLLTLRVSVPQREMCQPRPREVSPRGQRPAR